jgi:hypothetical protein
VTPEREAATSPPPGLDTKEMGEVMAPASGFRPSGGRNSGAGAAPVCSRRGALAGLLVCVLSFLACGGDEPIASSIAPARPSRPTGADPAQGMTTALDGVAPVYSQALLAELTGDSAAARAGFEKLLAAPEAPLPLAARAALHLAQLEARAGKSRRALELAARAAALAPSDVTISDGLAQLRADVVAASGTGDVRGPPPGTVLPGVDARLATEFAAAERALVAVHRFQPRPFEVVLGAKEDATEAVIERYRAIADRAGLVHVAASYRIGSLYHDLAFGLLFELPQLEPSVRGILRVRALGYLKAAITAYEACLAGDAPADAELWRAAAETDLRAAKDVLGTAA